MRGGKAARRKGDRAERALVKHLLKNGLAGTRRVPLSGAMGGAYAGDIVIPLMEVDRIAEVKVRANGFRQLYDWLAGNDLLIVKSDRNPPLVVIGLQLAAQIAAKAGAR
jgi:Holliday junction resolvase